jgi:hypothetical protein
LQEVRQVTLFGIRAVPQAKKEDGKEQDADSHQESGSSRPQFAGESGEDRRLARFRTQLLKILPNHDFRLTDVRSGRIAAGEHITCDLGNDYRTRITLIRPLDDDGKVELRCELRNRGTSVGSTTVLTPPNQLFFWERKLADGTRLLIGVGAR